MLIIKEAKTIINNFCIYQVGEDVFLELQCPLLFSWHLLSAFCMSNPALDMKCPV